MTFRGFRRLSIWRAASLLGLLGCAVLLLSSCLPAPTPLPPEPSATPAPPTNTPTPTVVWFPPTATFTPFPTLAITPTQDLRPPVGAIILTDDFTDPAAWNLAQTATSSVALGKAELTLALNQPEGYLYTLRNSPKLSDFYLEITASPSICRGEDEYGLLLRVSPSLEFYRFSLSCNGQVRLDKYFQGTASSPVPWTLSGAVPPGAPSQSRLAVWARGKEMRFFINGEYQFTTQDPSLISGSLGVFIRAAGEDAVTVSFSDLVISQANGN